DLLPLALQRAPRTEQVLGEIRWPALIADGYGRGTPAEDLFVERRRRLLRLRAELPSESGQAELILAQGRVPSSGLDVELHQRPVCGLLERVEREKSQCRLDRRLGRSGRALSAEEPAEGAESDFV